MGPAIFADFCRQKVDMLFAFDHAGTGDKRQRLALADLNLGTDFENHDLTADASRRSSGRGACAYFRANAFLCVLFGLLMLPCAAPDVRLRTRMRFERLRFVFGWNWQPRYQGCSGELTDFDVDAVGRFAGEAQAVLLSGIVFVFAD